MGLFPDVITEGEGEVVEKKRRKRRTKEQILADEEDSRYKPTDGLIRKSFNYFDFVVAPRAKYVGGSGPALAPATAALNNDGTGFIVDKLMINGQLRYIVGYTDRPHLKVSVFPPDIQEWVSPYAVESWEHQDYLSKQRIDDEEKRAKYAKQAEAPKARDGSPQVASDQLDSAQTSGNEKKRKRDGKTELSDVPRKRGRPVGWKKKKATEDALPDGPGRKNLPLPLTNASPPKRSNQPSLAVPVPSLGDQSESDTEDDEDEDESESGIDTQIQTQLLTTQSQQTSRQTSRSSSVSLQHQSALNSRDTSSRDAYAQYKALEREREKQKEQQMKPKAQTLLPKYFSSPSAKSRSNTNSPAPSPTPTGKRRWIPGGGAGGGRFVDENGYTLPLDTPNYRSPQSAAPSTRPPTILPETQTIVPQYRELTLSPQTQGSFDRSEPPSTILPPSSVSQAQRLSNSSLSRPSTILPPPATPESQSSTHAPTKPQPPTLLAPQHGEKKVEDEDGEDEEYEVEDIVGKDVRPILGPNGGIIEETYYLIKWKGYDSDENSWEPKRNVGARPIALYETQARKARDQAKKAATSTPKPKANTVAQPSSSRQSNDVGSRSRQNSQLSSSKQSNHAAPQQTLSFSKQNQSNTPASSSSKPNPNRSNIPSASKQHRTPTPSHPATNGSHRRSSGRAKTPVVIPDDAEVIELLDDDEDDDEVMVVST